MQARSVGVAILTAEHVIGAAAAARATGSKRRAREARLTDAYILGSTLILRQERA